MYSESIKSQMHKMWRSFFPHWQTNGKNINAMAHIHNFIHDDKWLRVLYIFSDFHNTSLSAVGKKLRNGKLNRKGIGNFLQFAFLWIIFSTYVGMLKKTFILFIYDSRLNFISAVIVYEISYFSCKMSRTLFFTKTGNDNKLKLSERNNQ